MHKKSPFPSTYLAKVRQNHPQAPLAKPEPSGSIPSQLVSNTFPNPLTPLCLDKCIPDTIPIPDPTLLQPSLFLASSQFPTSTLIPDPMPFNLLCSCIKSIPDVSSVSRLQSGKARSHTSPSFLALYISVHSSMPHRPLPSFHFSVSSSVPHLRPPLFHLSLFYPSVNPSLVFRTFLTTHSQSFRSTRSLPHPALV